MLSNFYEQSLKGMEHRRQSVSSTRSSCDTESSVADTLTCGRVIKITVYRRRQRGSFRKRASTGATL